MNVSKKNFIVFVLVGLLSTLLVGCGDGGPASTNSVAISPTDMAKSDISRANMFLDNIEKLNPAVRQQAASAPATMAALQAAAKADPTTKQRIDSLGLTLASK